MPRRRHGHRPRVYLHIGASKTGTTYLQALMAVNKDALAQAGILFPGDRWSRQVNAVRDVLAATRPAGSGIGSAVAWAELCDEVATWRGHASVISMEYLSFADADRAASIVRSFGDADVHVVLTIRDATSTIPGQWQTSCRNGGRVPYPHYVRAVRRSLRPSPQHRGRAYRIFQRAQGVPRMIAAWLPAVPLGNFHVVTVPPKGSDPTLLWTRFAKVVGVHPGVCAVQPPSSNPSLGYASTELIRRMNLQLGDVDRAGYFSVVRGHLARHVLEPRAGQERPVALDEAGVRLARRWNRRIRQAVVESGVLVVGTLDDLPVDPPVDAPVSVEPPSDEELLGAAETARAGLLALAADLSAGGRIESDAAEDDAGYDEADDDEADLVTATGYPAPQDPDAVDTAVAELANLVQRCIELSRTSTSLSRAWSS